MRLLLILRDPLETDPIRDRCGTLVAEGHEVAVCYVLAAEASLRVTLDAQRKITSVLRQVLDVSAEAIPIFVVTERDGDDIAECARAWGATEVRT